MMSDMERLVAAHLAAMESAPHIYLSALAWLPEGTFAYETLWKACTHLPIVANKEPTWDGARVTKNLDAYVGSIAYAPSGLYYATRGREEIHVWDTRTDRLALNLMSPSPSPYSLVFSLDGRWLASHSSDGSICIWTLETGEIRKTLKTIFDSDPGSPDVTSLVFSLDGTRIASAYDNGRILIWEVESENLIFNQDTGDGDVYSIAFSSDGKHIFSGSESLQVWDVDTGARIYTLPLGVSRFASSQDEKIIVSAVEDEDEDEEDEDEDWNNVSHLACSQDGKFIAAAVNGNPMHTVKLWNAQTYAAVGELGDVGDTVCLSFTGDSKEIYQCSESGSIRIWSAEALELNKRVDLEIKIRHASFSPDFQSILTGMFDSISIFDIPSGVAEKAPKKFLGAIYGVAISPDGHFIASRHAKSDYIHIWDAATGETAAEPLQGHSDKVSCLAFSNDGLWLVSGSDDHSVRIWDVLSDWFCGEPLLGHAEAVGSVVISSDSRLIASCSVWGETARIWEISTRLLVRTFEDAFSASFFPGGRWLATASRSRGGCMYDVWTGDLVTRFPNDDISTLVVSPNGRWIAYEAEDSIYPWSVSNGARRMLTGCECSVELKFTPDSLNLFLGESIKEYAKVSCWDVEFGTFLDMCQFNFRDSDNDLWDSDDKIAFSPDCKSICLYGTSHSYMHNVRIFNLALLEKITDNSSGQIRRWDNACFRLDYNDGWVKDDEGRLLMWVPERYREDIKNRQKLVIGKKGCRTTRPTIDYERLMDCLEKGWTSIYRSNV